MKLTAEQIEYLESSTLTFDELLRAPYELRSIERETIERCVRVAEDYKYSLDACGLIAAAIRALAEEEGPHDEPG